MKTSIGFIGGGRITRIILQAFKNKNMPLDNIAVSEVDANVSDILKSEYPDISIAGPDVAAAKALVFIALHPPVIIEMLEKIKKFVSPGTIIVSLAPKITVEKIRSKLENTTKIVRLIPNATSYINEGYNPVAFSGSISEEEKEQIMGLLNLLGTTFEVEEEKLEGYAIVSAMAPTYFWFQWETLSAIGEQIGLDKAEAKKAVYRTLKAALDLQFDAGLTFSEVLDLIPVKPICDYESDIIEIYNQKLIGLHQKIKS